MVFPGSDYDRTALMESGDNVVFDHSVFGAEKLRYSVDFGKSWTQWRDWEDTTTIPGSGFRDKKFFWKGNHVVMNCRLFLLSSHRVYADRVYRFQIGLWPRALPPPSYMPTSNTTYPAESPASSPGENSIDLVPIRTFLRR